MKKILLLMAIVLPFVFSSCDKDEPGGSKKHDYVDLGLPSGTLWATCNVGAKSPEEYGDYFAWGETSPKNYYTFFYYELCNQSEFKMTKYSIYSSYGMVDNKIELDPEDDAAYVNWGSSWRMPTLAQIRELCDYCTRQMTQQNGVIGQLITGPNGNSIFLPAAGVCREDDIYAQDKCGYYWSRTLSCGDEPDMSSAGPGCAYIQFFSPTEWGPGSITGAWATQCVQCAPPRISIDASFTGLVGTVSSSPIGRTKFQKSVF